MKEKKAFKLFGSFEILVLDIFRTSDPILGSSDILGMA
jgi:hypothetical protein